MVRLPLHIILLKVYKAKPKLESRPADSRQVANLRCSLLFSCVGSSTGLVVPASVSDHEDEIGVSGFRKAGYCHALICCV